MNKKIVTLILIILISFSYLNIIVAVNTTLDDDNVTDYDMEIDNGKKDDTEPKVVENQTTEEKNTTDEKETDENQTDDKPKKNYITAKGNGNDIKFSDGFRGFRLNYKKSAASSGDEFIPASTSEASNSNTL